MKQFSVLNTVDTGNVLFLMTVIQTGYIEIKKKLYTISTIILTSVNGKEKNLIHKL